MNELTNDERVSVERVESRIATLIADSATRNYANRGSGMDETVARLEWGIFPKGQPDAMPAENMLYKTWASAQQAIQRKYRENADLWEVRGRVVGPWSLKGAGE